MRRYISSQGLLICAFLVISNVAPSLASGEKIPPLVSPRCWSLRTSSNVIVANLPHEPLVVNDPTDVSDSIRLCSPLGDLFEARKLITGLEKGVAVLKSTSAESSEKARAAMAFGSLWTSYGIKYSPAQEVLRETLKSEDRALRKQAAIALAHYGDVALARPVLLLETEFKLLAQLDDRESLERIRAALTSKTFKERGQALFALILFGEPEQALLPHIREGLKETNEVLKATYVRALGQLAGPESRALLKELSASDESEYIRSVASEVYSHLDQTKPEAHE